MPGISLSTSQDILDSINLGNNIFNHKIPWEEKYAGWLQRIFHSDPKRAWWLQLPTEEHPDQWLDRSCPPISGFCLSQTHPPDPNTGCPCKFSLASRVCSPYAQDSWVPKLSLLCPAQGAWPYNCPFFCLISTTTCFEPWSPVYT